MSKLEGEGLEVGFIVEEADGEEGEVGELVGREGDEVDVVQEGVGVKGCEARVLTQVESLELEEGAEGVGREFVGETIGAQVEVNEGGGEGFERLCGHTTKSILAQVDL